MTRRNALKIAVVGSGAGGVHFALTALEMGHEVLMLDVGRQKPAPVRPADGFRDLKADLDDPVRYFLGDRFEAVLFPDDGSEYYGFPPSKSYVFEPQAQFEYASRDFAPLVSFARGGLAEAWTAGVYPLNDHELAAYPFGYRELEPFYADVARRIGVIGVDDDLCRFFPLHAHLLPPLELDAHSQTLLRSYERHRSHLNERLGCYFGRSRVATLSRDLNGRKACTYLGRCLWGCPTDSFYTPSITLRQCQTYPSFTYVPETFVTHFTPSSRGRVTSVTAESLRSGVSSELPVDVLVLAAGTLGSSKILLDSLLRSTGDAPRLTGLMDNRQILMPFVNLRMVGRPYEPQSYQYHQLALGLQTHPAQEYVHGQITTLKTALIHPIIQKAPFDLRTSSRLFRNTHASLGVVNVNFHDTRRPENYVSLETDRKSKRSRLVIEYAPPPEEHQSIKQAIRRIKKALWKLGCVVPPGMSHVRGLGASVHYAGTVLMSRRPAPLTASEHCRSHDFENLYFVDATTFPFLPAKNLTFTLMANAVRVAKAAFS